MAVYYVDCSNGAGVDSAGKGTTTGDPYLTIEYALNDIVDTHGKATGGDKLLVIGTSTPSAAITADIVYYAPSSTYALKIASDGKEAFGTHNSLSPTERATIDLDANSVPGWFNSLSIDYTSIAGFNVIRCSDDKATTTNVYFARCDDQCSFTDLYCDMSNMNVNNFYQFAQGQAAFTFCNNTLIGMESTTSANTYILYCAGGGSNVVNNNYFEVFNNQNYLTIYGCYFGAYAQCSGNIMKAKCKDSNTNAIEFMRYTGNAYFHNNEIYGEPGHDANDRITMFKTTSTSYGHGRTVNFNNHAQHIGTMYDIPDYGITGTAWGGDTYYDIDTYRNCNFFDPISEAPSFELSSSGCRSVEGRDFSPSIARLGITWENHFRSANSKYPDTYNGAAGFADDNPILLAGM